MDSPRRQKNRLILLLLLGAIAAGVPGTLRAGDALPFAPGERLDFRVRWGIIPAARATLRVLPMTTVNGVPCYHFVATARTRPLVDLFYKVRDRIDAYCDARMTRSLFYRERRLARNEKNVTVSFDWKHRVARYSRNGKKRAPVALLPGTFDPLSIFYAFRLAVLTEGGEIDRPVSDGKKCVMGKARVIRKERIRVPCGTFATYLVEPDLAHIGGVFKKSRGAKLRIWVSADRRRIPVRIKSRVSVGSFVADLVSRRFPAGPGEGPAR